MKIMKERFALLKVLNAFAFVAMVAINVLAQVMPLGGMTTAEISALYPIYLTPIGLSFSIWSLIYIAMGWFVIQQFISKDNNATQKVGGLFAATCALNIGWIISWHYQIMLLAVISIIALWMLLLLIDSRMKGEKWYLRGGFAIYYAWITAATAIQIVVYISKMIPIVNGSIVSIAVTVAAIMILTGFGLEKVLREKDNFFGLTIAWALLGILLKQITGGAATFNPIVEAFSGFAFLLIIAAAIWLRPRLKNVQEILE